MRDLIHQATMIGNVLMMMPGVPVNEDTISSIARHCQDGEDFGAAAVRLGAVTPEQLTRALTLQAKMRTMTDLDDVARFFEEIREAAARARSAVYASIGG